MSEIETNSTWFDAVGDVLTRLTLDLRSAIQNSSDSDSRIRAFALLHTSINTSQILASGVWGDAEESAQEAAQVIVARCQKYPEEYPEWLRITAAKWEARLRRDAPSLALA